MPYQPPVDEFQFLFDRVIGPGDVPVAGLPDGFDSEECRSILEVVGALARDVIMPVRRTGDINPPRLENGIVRVPPQISSAYRQVAAGGWVGMSASPDHGGAGLPFLLANAANEMINSGCMSLGLCIMLTQSQIRTLEAHASPDIRKVYLPRLSCGDWIGTMNITEPSAGSDVGSIRSTARKTVGGNYRLSGQKIFISWADADFAENVCHLVLARRPGAPSGTKGLSLFLVPKFVPDQDGRPGRRNEVRIRSLEQKLGLHGSPTAVVEFDNAEGWMIGAGESGMPAMFTMMNMARLGVGCQGVAIAQAALCLAADHASTRTQGNPVRKDGTGTIIDHANVRRLLGLMKAELFAARAICASCALAIDHAEATGDLHWQRRVSLLTPLAKVYGSEVGLRAASRAIDVYGGMGYVEETGVGQLLRDSVVATIYEGSNGIQAIDLATRRLRRHGEDVFCLLAELENDLDRVGQDRAGMSARIRAAMREVRQTTSWLADQQDRDVLLAASHPYLHALAILLGSCLHHRASAACDGRGPRAALARIYVDRILPACSWHCQEARNGADDLFDLADDDLKG